MTKKDPAFLFYSSDFLTGVIELTMEERGQYITLMCLQHQKGRLSEKLIKSVIPNISDDVLLKFEQDKNGNFFNKRLDFETKKRQEHSKKQRENVMKRWNSNKERGMPSNIPTQYDGNTTVLPLENENENENVIRNKIDFISFKEIYNQECNNIPSVRTITEKRKTAIKKFLKEFSKDEFSEVCREANKSSFLTGDNDRGWRADFDFLIRPDKAASVLEGKYAGKERNDDKPKYKLECLEL